MFDPTSDDEAMEDELLWSLPMNHVEPVELVTHEYNPQLDEPTDDPMVVHEDAAVISLHEDSELRALESLARNGGIFSARTVPDMITLKVPVSLRTYEWLKSFTMRNVRELRPTERGWDSSDQKNLFMKLQLFLQQKCTITSTHAIVEETYGPATSGFCGRFYSHDGCQSLYRPIRTHVLAETADLDQSCAMQRILLWTCKCFGLSALYLQQYVHERDQALTGVIQSHGITKSAAKELFQIAWTSDSAMKSVRDPFLRLFDKEAKENQRRLMEVEELQWILPFCNAHKNRAGSFISHLFQFIECKLTLRVFEELTSRGIEVVALIFDGMHLADGALFSSDEVLRIAHDACETIAPGINMVWAWKAPDFMIRSKVTQEDIRELTIPSLIKLSETDQEAAFLAEAAEFDKYVFKVDCEYVDLLCDPHKPTRSSKKEIILRYDDKQYRWEDARHGEQKHAQFIHKWLEHYDGKVRYKRFDFVPPTLPCAHDVYNLWTPWPVESFEYTVGPERRAYLLGSVLKHIAILANHDKHNYEFILKFFAQYVQFVHKKGGVMLILTGAQGCGKSTFVKLLRVMFGEHFLSSSKPEINVWGPRFNGELQGKTLIELSELDRGNVHGNIDHVKDLISNDTLHIEEKYARPLTMPNYLRFLGITNDPVPMRHGRRIACVESSDELVPHPPVTNFDGSKTRCTCDHCANVMRYHTEMNDVVMVDKNTALDFYEYLKAYKLQKEVLTEVDIPVNEAYERVVEASTSQEKRFLKHLATDPAMLESYTPGELWFAFKEWRELNEPGNVYIKGEHDLITKMGVLCAKVPGCTRDRKRAGAVVVDGKITRPHVRVWKFDQAALCKHFDIPLDVGDDQSLLADMGGQAARKSIHDLDEEARLLFSALTTSS